MHESYNSQPDETVAFYPDPSDPIDVLLDNYRQVVAHDYLPSSRQQRNLITGIQRKDVPSARQLLAINDGLIAAVTYPFKHRGIASRDLLIIGRRTLLQLALDYPVNGDDDFNDRAIVAMENSLCEATQQEPAASKAASPDFRPMDRVVRFVTSIEEIETYEPIFPPSDTARHLVGTLASRLTDFKRKKAAALVADLSPVQQMILPLLPYLPASDIAQKANFSRGSFTQNVKVMMNELGVDTKPELVLVAHDGGVPFDIKTSTIEELTLRERQVGCRLFMPNKQIAAELGMTKYAADYAAKTVMSKIGARTRLEALLMAQTPGFDPTPQEIQDAQPLPGLEDFTRPQADVLQRLHLTYKTISEELDRSTDAIKDMYIKLRRRLGVTTNAAMALKMRKRGVVYDIKVPNSPLAELLNSEVMEVAENVADYNETIAKNLGLDPGRVHDLVNYARRQTGARTRAELLLIVKEFDTGERREKGDNRTRKQILAERLGLKTLDACDIDALLAGVTPQQRQILTLYYLVDETEQQPKSWTDIKKEFGIYNPASAAYKAVKQMRKSLGTDNKNA